MKNKIKTFIKNHKKLYLFISKMKSRREKLLMNSSFCLTIYNLIHGKRIVSGKMVSVKEYCKENKIVVTTLSTNNDRAVYHPPFIGGSTKGELVWYKTPEIYHCVLNDVIVVPTSNLIMSGGKWLNDKLLLSYSNVFDYKYWPVVKADESNCSVVIKKHKTHIKNAISLMGDASNNFYHWTFDLVSRMCYVNMVDLPPDTVILIDSAVSSRESCMKLLTYSNKKNYKIVVTKPKDTFEIENLFYFSPCTWSNVYGKTAGELLAVEDRLVKDDFAISSLRDAVISNISVDNQEMPKSLFITRPEWAVKRLVNEKELSIISKDKYGFTTVEPSALSLLEQARLFNNADVIVADEGAALVNMIWCKKGTKVYCIIPEEWHDYNYATIAYAAGVDIYYVKAKLLEGQFHQLDESVFIKLLDGIVKEAQI